MSLESNKAQTVIRRLRRSDITEVACIHCEQFPTSRTSRLGAPFVRKMYRWFLYHQPELALVATIDGKPVGFVTGAVGGYGRRITRYALPQIVWGLLTHPRLLFNPTTFRAWTSYLQAFRPSFLSRQQPAAANITGGASSGDTLVKASIASIAVTESAQGQGLGKALLAAFEEAAKGRGATLLGLSVDDGNVAARRLYESCNWRAVSADSDSTYYTKSLL